MRSLSKFTSEKMASAIIRARNNGIMGETRVLMGSMELPVFDESPVEAPGEKEGCF